MWVANWGFNKRMVLNIKIYLFFMEFVESIRNYICKFKLKLKILHEIK